MKYLVSSLVLVFLAVTCKAQSYYDSERLHCYSCTLDMTRRLYSYQTRNYNCVANLSRIRTVRCSRGYYCRTSYVSVNGIVTSVSRGCQSPFYDHVSGSDEVPSEETCTSGSATYPLTGRATTCYISCNSSRCNKDTPSSIRDHANKCRYGNCNNTRYYGYINAASTGGRNCPSRCYYTCDENYRCPQKQCVQCDSETDPQCDNKTAVTNCSGSSVQSCAVITTHVLNFKTSLVHKSVSKTCTAATYLSRPCQFITSGSGSSSEYSTYSCTKLCSANGCNANLHASDAEETQNATTKTPLRCAVCTSDYLGSCATYPYLSLCPASSTHCKSTATYYLLPYADSNGQQSYSFESIKRECASEPVTRQCNTTVVKGPGLEYVTCQETCDSDGCNVGWPARPNCSQCYSSVDSDGIVRSNVNCSHDPPAPSQCPYPMDNHCFIYTNNTAAHPDYRQGVRRGCRRNALESRCFDIKTEAGDTVNHCEESCNTNGCNTKPVS